MCPVLISSTPRSIRKKSYQGNNFYNYFFFIIIIIKVVTLVKLCPIYLVIVLSILAWKFRKWHAFPTTPIVAWSFSGTQPICCSPASVRENTPIPFCEPRVKVLRKNTSFSFVRRLPFLSYQPLFWLQKTLTSHL